MSRSANKAENEPETIVTEYPVDRNMHDLAPRRYIKGRFLGKGGFAKVYEFRSIDQMPQKIFAAKLVEKSSLQKTRARQKLMSEIKIHRSLKHENIVEFQHYFEDEDNVYILLELCTNLNLNDTVKRRKRFTEVEVQCYSVQILQGLKYLHSQRVIHRDLKLGNLFISDKMQIKLGDLGLAAKLDFTGERKRTVCGTPNYIAPEVLDNQIGHSFEVDIWSFGVIMYAMLFGKPPFETSEIKETYKRIKALDYKFPENVLASQQARDVIKSILVLDPLKRPTVDQILDMDFFQLNEIPKALPTSTLACPPSPSYLQQYMPDGKNQPKQDAAVHGTRHSVKKKVNQQGPSQYIKSWVDYSQKYGVGYITNKDCVGVYFNDNSKLIQDPQKVFWYFERVGVQKQDQSTRFTASDVPAQLNKKFLIHKKFQQYICGSESDDESSQQDLNNKKPPRPLSVQTKGGECEVAYVKKFVRTKHAIMFRLSTSLVQVIFQDQTEVLMCTDTRLVTYRSKSGMKNTFTMRECLQMEQNYLQGVFAQEALDIQGNEVNHKECHDFLKRLRYSKDLISSLMRKPQPNNDVMEQEIE